MNVFTLFETKNVEDIKLALKVVKSLNLEKEFEDYFDVPFSKYENNFNNVYLVISTNPHLNGISLNILRFGMGLTSTYSDDIITILYYHPQLIDYLDVSILSGYGICELLKYHPQLIDKFDKQSFNDKKVFKYSAIKDLLTKQPQLASYFNTQ